MDPRVIDSGLTDQELRLAGRPQTKSLAEQIGRLERSVRQLRMLVGVALIAAAGVVLLGGWTPQQVQELVFARSFELVDRNGVTRAVLGFDVASEPRLSLYDEVGRLRSYAGSEHLVFYDEGGTERSAMGLEEISFHDERGTGRSQIGPRHVFFNDVTGVGRSFIGPTRIALNGEGGELGMQLGAEGITLEDAGAGSLRVNLDAISFHDEEGTGRAALGSEHLTFRDRNDAWRSVLGSERIFFSDENDQTRLQLGSLSVATLPSREVQVLYPAALMLLDAEGRVIWQAPPR